MNWSQQGALPDWYVRVGAVANPVWSRTKEHLIALYWLPGIRCFYSGKTPKAGLHNAEVFFSQGMAIQKRIQQEIHMASKEPFKMKGWVNINLTPEDKDAILSDELAIAEMFEDLGALVFKGYRFSMSWDDYSEAIQSSLVCANPDDPNFGCGLSSRHPDPDVSLKSLMYKFSIASALPWSEQLSRPKGENWS